jgi:type II secretory ATPase GspE/PulE/Tfp pilus assembly ATPase PilB-like protein
MRMRKITGKMIERFMEDGMAMWPIPEKWMLAFKWRVGLYEMLEFDDEVRQMLLEWEKALAVEKYAMEHKGMINLERDAVFKMIQWKISIEEVYRLVKHKTYK